MKVYLIRFIDDPYEPHGVTDIFDSREKADAKLSEMLKEMTTTPMGNTYNKWFENDIYVDEWEVK